LRPSSESRTGETLTGKPHGDIFANYAVKWRARRVLNADADSLSGVKQNARQRGVCGETSRIGICEGMDMFL
jgi:hypothetical protein